MQKMYDLINTFMTGTYGFSGLCDLWVIPAVSIDHNCLFQVIVIRWYIAHINDHVRYGLQPLKLILYTIRKGVGFSHHVVKIT